MFNLDQQVSKLVREVAEKKDAMIREQLSELISRGLIIVEETEPTIVTHMDPVKGPQIEFRQACKLVLRDKEYIVKLENENNDLKLKLEKMAHLCKEFLPL